jgi:adenine phosphoribosyltransferase
MEISMKNYASYIRNVPDFPVKGIQFKDITTLIKNGDLFAETVDLIYEPFRSQEINKIVSIEARGFIFGAALAYKLNIGFIPVRKPGKLPADTVSAEYELEYGQDSIEIHKDAIEKGEKVLIVDDLLATGGTAVACCQLIEKLKGEVAGLSFLIELIELDGRKLLKEYKVRSLISFPF